MKKILVFLCSIVVIISISGCSAKEDTNMLKVSKSSDDIVGENYQTVISELQKIGFTNVETKVLDDLITGWLTKDGEIEGVEIDGDTQFKSSDTFSKDSKIVITYHTFPIKDENAAEATDGKSSEVVEETNKDEIAESNDEILTVENNAELAAILAETDPGSSIVSEFAKKYAGKIIEFDGNISNMMNNSNYKTRYDILIGAGDYSESTAIGPYFKFENVNIFDLNLTGSEIPDSISAGQNLRITAEVKEYKENSQLFMLKPISTKIR